jgi:hypothetical protein
MSAAEEQIMRPTTVGIIITAIAIGGDCLADIAPAAKTKEGAEISPNGQPVDAREGKISDQPPRYYVWVDPQGWHLRCAAKKGGHVRFEGTLELSDGEFGRLRPVGLEKKPGKVMDAWGVDATRRKLEFKIFTAGSFDGLDFTIAKAKEAQISFDLKITDKPAPGRTFIGKDSVHPAASPFSLPAEP